MGTCEQLRAFLLSYFPRDVLMPCVRGAKAPAFPHAGEPRWDWVDFDSVFDGYEREAKFLSKYDVGILLQDLVVVDIDSPVIVAEMEERFPALKLAPSEVTRKGVHYYFCRTPLCDAHGFYDGAAQVVQGVDFKTVTAKGSSGLILVAPSTDKRWVRPLWTGPADHMQSAVQPIPDDLLLAVAVPQHPPAKLLADFGDDGCLDLAPHTRYTRHMTLLAPFYEDVDHDTNEPTMGTTVPLGGSGFSRDLFEHLLHLLSAGVTRDFPTPELIQDLSRLADYLGVPKHLVRSLQPHTGTLWHMLDAEHVVPGMGRGMFASALPCGADIREAGVAVEVPPVIEPINIPRTEDWLFPAAKDTPPFERRAQLEVPPCVRDVLLDHPGRLILAGSAALAALVHGVKCNDYDLFMVADSVEDANAVAASLCARPGWRLAHQSGVALSFVVQDSRARDREGEGEGGGEEYAVQLITRLYNKPDHVVRKFDVQAAMAYLEADPDTPGALRARALPCCLTALATRTIVLDIGAWGRASVVRWLKYASHGFHIYVPCIRRSTLNPGALLRAKPSSVGALYNIARLMRRRSNDLPSARQVRVHTMGLVASDYSGLMKAASKLKYWLKWLVKRVLRRSSTLDKGRAQGDGGEGGELSPRITWTRVPSRNRCFNACSPGILEILKPDAL
ncbi:hypothetical protein HYH03_015064 [Edaphochlamys debaryana]|uniref:DNA primase/polymerase bifunctional N-terminal domain-containing protein n=1 Tax=Edaphochlamys debaryana TaxID=47281 RepID=A0A835XMI6_9CHLO|nr:hypothetical protein HYH03_015064 [Edaphochlamys debaryana]|eukprot:KAG2486239.1 hypothetical protein HYH03_015064 [Edaphochlamys debaryana]